MKAIIQCLLAGSVLLLGGSDMVLAQGTAFTYQGRLNDNGGPAQGTYDLTFLLFEAAMGNNPIGGTITNTAIGVSNGLFTATLNFGPGVFSGPERWLQIGVRTNGTGDFTPLTPRQLLTTSPYAIMANSASNLLGKLPASQLSGTLPTSVLEGTFTGALIFDNPANIFAGLGTWLTGLNASNLVSGTVADTLLSSNVALRNGDQIFSGSNRFSGVVELTNSANAFGGNGSALTGLDPAHLTSGTAGINISGNAATATTAAAAGTAASAFSLIGAFVGDVTGSQGATTVERIRGIPLSNTIPSANQHLRFDGSRWVPGGVALETDVTGTLSVARLSTNVALLDSSQTFTRSNIFSGVTQLTNKHNNFVGSFTGDGAGLSNVVVFGANILGPVSVAQLAGTLPTSVLAGTYNNPLAFNNPANSFTGNGAGLSDVNAAALGGLRAERFWQLGGNTATTTGVDFLGTTDNHPLELRVNNTRALRLEPNTSGAPNVIGGAPVNSVAAGVIGSTISGGGIASGMESNSISSDFATIGGGSGNAIESLSNASGAFASISGGHDNSIRSAERSVIGGGANNLIFSSRLLAGTYENINSDSTISGGRSNSVEAPFSTVGGGIQNQVARDEFFLDGRITNGTIAGGISNRVWGSHSTIGGGRYNKISVTGRMFIPGREGGDCTIGGGSFNRLLEYPGESLTGATIGGGSQNTISEWSDYSFIGGGLSNYISYYSPGSSISGGQNNSIDISVLFGTISGGFSNSMDIRAHHCSIGGGIGNRVSNTGNSVIGATVSGGSQNTISNASFATIPGGANNAANGQYSYAAGCRAKANHPGSFVWADSSAFDFPSSNDNQFSVRSVGGVRFVSGVNGTGTPTAGVGLDPGSGSWASLSDRNAKENFTPTQSREVLEKLSRVPITTWNYKSQDASIRHIGPMAQDFSAAFGVGSDEKHITTVDADGVALAAIQGLNEIVKEKEAKIQALEKRLADVEKVLKTLTQRENGDGQ